MSLTLDMTQFDKAVKFHGARSRRTLPQVINARAFYLFLRAFVLLPPRSAVEQAEKVRDYLNTYIAERGRITTSGKYKGRFYRYGRNRQYQRVHAIVQSRQPEGQGLYGTEMRKAVTTFRRRALGSVGYLKSGVVRILQRLNGHFAQYGVKRRGKPDVPPNNALIQIANEYSVTGSNVRMHKGVKSRAYPAKEGYNPKAIGVISVAVKDDQAGNVQAIYQSALARAVADETRAMIDHITAQYADDARRAGFGVKIT